MIESARKPSLATRLRNLVAGDGGFTLLETLAVMVIVGLLAAITVPQISKWREKAYITSMKTDARNVANAVEASFVDSQTYPATDAVAGAPTFTATMGTDIKLSDGNSIVSFTNNANSSFTFKITNSKVAAGTNKVATYTSTGSPTIVLAAS